jgi:hypothetical protein
MIVWFVGRKLSRKTVVCRRLFLDLLFCRRRQLYSLTSRLHLKHPDLNAQKSQVHRPSASNINENNVMTRHNSDFTHTASHHHGDNKETGNTPIKQRTVELLHKGYRCVIPLVYKSGYFMSEQAKRIHQRGNWGKRCSKTLFSNSVSLAMGMLAAHIVQSSVETSQFSNLWGILATKPIVSESTYQTMNFLVKFGVTVIVFTLTEHLISEYRQRTTADE